MYVRVCVSGLCDIAYVCMCMMYVCACVCVCYMRVCACVCVSMSGRGWEVCVRAGVCVRVCVRLCVRVPFTLHGLRRGGET